MNDDRYELLVTDKTTGRADKMRFRTIDEAYRAAVPYIPTKGDRNFRVSIRDLRKDVQDPTAVLYTFA